MAASVIIDGYNLIGTMHRDLQKARKNLILKLSEYKKRTGNNITVVFDGWKEGGASEHVSTEGGIRIIFSPIGKTADAVIAGMLSKAAESIVVSSDRQVQSSAWAKGAVPVESDIFASILDAELCYDVDEGAKRRGRTPSKREKAVKRAIRKLAG